MQNSYNLKEENYLSSDANTMNLVAAHEDTLTFLSVKVSD